MNFRARWVLLALVLAAAVFLFLTPLWNACHCETCPRLAGQAPHLGDPDIVPNIPGGLESGKNMQSFNSMRQASVGEKAESEYRLKTRDRMRGLKRPTGSSQSMHIDGWIVDCVTWEKQWEVTPLDSAPHDFPREALQLGKGEEPSHRRKTFQKIYEKRDWPANDASYTGLQSSGPGAMLKNSQRAMSILHAVIARLKTYLGKNEISILDLPCGDLQWMSKFLMTRTDVQYTGADIVPDLIQHHREKFFRIPKAQFIQWDIVEKPLNRSYDLVLIRDLLQHLWRVDAMQVLSHISESGSSFLLTTTYPDTTGNLEVEKDALGSRRSPYNLELPPFLLPPPACMTYDWNVEHLALWALPLKQKYEY